MLAAVPSTLFAHPGHDEFLSASDHLGHDLAPGFIEGVLHPLSGIDHVLAMIMVGMLAVRLGGRASWILPAAFVTAMAVGALAGLSGITPFAVEAGIALSVVVLGMLLALRVRAPMLPAVALVSAIALFHGQAHGAGTAGVMSLAYLGGVLLGTAVLHLGGIAIGFGIAGSRRGELAARVAGIAAAGAGIVLLAPMLAPV